MDKLVLIDGNSIMNRAFYGIMGSKMLTTKDGKYTNAVYGFLAILFKLLEDIDPNYLVVAFDLKAPTSSHITQSIKTDKNGVFSFVMNHKGWWGFAALIEEGEKELNGKKYPIENGALLWLKAY